jgi:hypothetical protein
MLSYLRDLYDAFLQAEPSIEVRPISSERLLSPIVAAEIIEESPLPVTPIETVPELVEAATAAEKENMLEEIPAPLQLPAVEAEITETIPETLENLAPPSFFLAEAEQNEADLEADLAEESNTILEHLTQTTSHNIAVAAPEKSEAKEELIPEFIPAPELAAANFPNHIDNIPPNLEEIQVFTKEDFAFQKEYDDLFEDAEINELSFLESPIPNLRMAFGINDRFLNISELFSGNAKLYDEVIEQLNYLSNFLEARQYLEQKVLSGINWNEATRRKRALFFLKKIKRRYY